MSDDDQTEKKPGPGPMKGPEQMLQQGIDMATRMMRAMEANEEFIELYASLRFKVYDKLLSKGVPPEAAAIMAASDLKG
jgi:hypothetical protein